ncbi:F-box protein At5g07610-like [Bidens hawaiensis]|uniref:F-box protein At5g07610-like n=2 Tax=Bidens hawaiensis TaxID=980011 RepID=UPI004048F270
MFKNRKLISPPTGPTEPKSVSKRWFSLITDANFALRRSETRNTDPPSGILLQRQFENFTGYDFVPLDTRIPAYRYPSFNAFNSDFLERNIQLLHSCNGLVLLCFGQHELHVFNPSMNLLYKLPEFNESAEGEFTASARVLAFDPTKSPHYKVVIVGAVYRGNNDCFSQARTYSSETRAWKVHDELRFWINMFRVRVQDGLIYLNDSIYWLMKVNELHSMVLKLDVEVLTLKSTATPVGKAHSDPKLFESRGRLLLARVECTNELNIYTMTSEFLDCHYLDWSVKYTVKLNDILWMFPKTNRPHRRVCADVKCIVVGENEEESFLVIERNGMVMRYKFRSNTLNLLCDLGSKVKAHDNLRTLQFIASFAGVM